MKHCNRIRSRCGRGTRITLAALGAGFSLGLRYRRVTGNLGVESLGRHERPARPARALAALLPWNEHIAPRHAGTPAEALAMWRRIFSALRIDPQGWSLICGALLAALVLEPEAARAGDDLLQRQDNQGEFGHSTSLLELVMPAQDSPRCALRNAAPPGSPRAPSHRRRSRPRRAPPDLVRRWSGRSEYRSIWMREPCSARTICYSIRRAACSSRRGRSSEGTRSRSIGSISAIASSPRAAGTSHPCDRRTRGRGGSASTWLST
jgi:hypothetical protein